METNDVPELNELTEWIKTNVLDVQDLSPRENLSGFSIAPEPKHKEAFSIHASAPKVMSREEEELSLLEYIIGIDGMP